MPQKGEEEALHFLPIGETGTGKTTLINSFANFARYGNLEEAIENGPVVLSDVGFSYSIAGMRRDPVFVKGSSDNGKELVNYLGMTQTEGCSLYTFESDDSQQLTFYDSPGFGNRNGQQVNLIERPANAYIIVLKPDETRLNHDLCTFLKNEGKAVSKNIIYCFTNARASNDLQSSTTLIALKSYLNYLEQSLGVEFPTKRENVFCFENDCFRYLCYLSTNPGGGNPSRQNVYSNEWNSNVKNFQRLIRHVKTLPAIMHQELDTLFPGPSNLVSLQPQSSGDFELELPFVEEIQLLKRVQCLVPHLVQDTLAINSVQNAFNSRAKVLVEQVVDLLLLKETHEANIEELERFRADKVCALKEVEATKMVYDERRIGCLRLVCTSSKCIKAIRLIDGTIAMMSRLCHDNCQVRKETHDTTHLQKCAVFTFNENTETSKSKTRGRISNCHCCDCPWTTHEHANTEYFPAQRKSDQDSADANRINKELDKNLAELKGCQIELIKTQDRIQVIDAAVSEASAYLSVHTIKKGTDPFLYYLDRQLDIEVTSLTYIKQLIQKHEKIAENSKLKVIQAVRQRYLGRVDSITSAIRRKERTTMTSETLLRMMVV